MSTEKNEGKLTRVYIAVAENGFEIECSYAPKKSLSQRAGWTPAPYEEPKKYVVNNKAELIAHLNKVL